jgi:hypothetical protein
MEKENEHGNSEVDITVDDRPRRIHRGAQTVAEIKRVGEVTPGYELSQILSGTIKDLDQNGKVVIHGGEIFVSHTPNSKAS